MRAHQDIFHIEKMAEVLKISRSGYYRFLQRPPTVEKLNLLTQIKMIFEENKGRYGAPRIHAELKKQGIHTSRHHVEKLKKMA
ncbi:MAG: IS3 family transposase [Verrucomicrobia bacterium]|nr:IS3 family transposase [Verrucomicrobiota bacterium]